MKCGVCGKETDEGSGYCSHCGSPLPAKSRFVPVSKREWALVVVAVAFMLFAAVGLAIALGGDDDPEPPRQVWLSEDIVAFGPFTDGTFDTTVTDDGRMEVFFTEIVNGDISSTWELLDPSGVSDSWWEMGPVTRIETDDLPSGMYILTVINGGQETSGTFVILPSPDAGGDA